MKAMYENPEVCGKCGGECCKRKPGYFWPEDIPGPCVKHTILKMLRSRKVVIDWWEEDKDLPQTYMLSPHVILVDELEHNRVFYPLWGGQCRFLTPSGCELSADLRPLQCKLLDPKEDGKCEYHCTLTKLDCAKAWRPYHDALKALGEIVEQELKDKA